MAAKPYTTILLLAFLLLLSSSSSARLLNDNNIPQGLAALDPESNFVLPVIINDGRRVLPCDMGKEEEVSTSTRKSQVIRMTPRLAGKYGRLVLNMLPKGPVPPSGPSRGTNNLNN